MTGSSRGIATVLRKPAILAFTGKYHGLGNRVRVVLGSQVLARRESRAFAYTWPTGAQFGARFDQLWEFDAPTVPAALSRVLAPRFPYRDHQLNWLDDDARTQRLWQIRTPHAIELPPDCPRWETTLRALAPTSQVAARIRRAFDNGPAARPYVGVMIRVNPIAHTQTLNRSPLEWYLNRMREIREFWPDVPFYIAADTPDAFLAVSSAFPGCFGTADKGAYNSERALVASVVDLYLLASSSHLLGPHYSSFPQLAQLLAGDQLRLETSMTSRDTVLTSRDALTTADDPLRPFDRHSAS